MLAGARRKMTTQSLARRALVIVFIFVHCSLPAPPSKMCLQHLWGATQAMWQPGLWVVFALRMGVMKRVATPFFPCNHMLIRPLPQHTSNPKPWRSARKEPECKHLWEKKKNKPPKFSIVATEAQSHHRVAKWWMSSRVVTLVKVYYLRVVFLVCFLFVCLFVVFLRRKGSI